MYKFYCTVLTNGSPMYPTSMPWDRPFSSTPENPSEFLLTLTTTVLSFVIFDYFLEVSRMSYKWKHTIYTLVSVWHLPPIVSMRLIHAMCVSEVSSFLFLGSMLLCCLSFLLFMDIWVVFWFGLLWIKLLWLFLNKPFENVGFHFSWTKKKYIYPRVAQLN